jgi:hypothetical protein
METLSVEHADKMDKKLSILFEFLKENRTYNKYTQEAYYKSVLKPYQSVHEKVISLLYGIINTQSQPKLDFVGDFMRKAYDNVNLLGSYIDFLRFLGSNDFDNRYCRIFELLNKCPGWGGKTAALFEKTIYHLHNGLYDNDLRIWEDAPVRLVKNDRIYLPVDTVIINVFKLLGCTTLSFNGINKLILNAGYENEQLEIWDDLWFWGYITQKGSGQNRQIIFNESKYWAYPYFNKQNSIMNEIKEKAGYFIKIIRMCDGE